VTLTIQGGIEPAQRVVERGDMAGFRVVGEEGEHVVVTEDVLDKTVQRLRWVGLKILKVRLTDLEKMLRKA
jgi:hypothetical protein